MISTNSIGSISDSNVILETILKKYPIDAFYCLNPNTSENTFVFRYQIYRDFKISEKKVNSKVFCLIPLNVDDIEYSSGFTEDILFSRPFTKSKVSTTLNLNFAPLPAKVYPQLPRCFLTKNCKGDELPKPLSISLILPDPHRSSISDLLAHKRQETSLIYMYLKSHAAKHQNPEFNQYILRPV
ncbi:unnamed protein product [Moneuplotes crassus]|uniref:Uncharacterized protein n=1 Tax=Euplotes crassus TaxID=5936 RepID=A0AAD1U369_EUPCR|nr:unnamed protein product [Moneuplotes crassus]